ncbi:MAG: class I SAM-dependent methyltransferase [Bacteroidetes bacterium]|nr:class I SAM-dependent methyltransferase [Bacteroidota bacterium]MBS1541089.1 class I SAM-dependent methyltransferase [Bacteroidota bacterium]
MSTYFLLILIFILLAINILLLQKYSRYKQRYKQQGLFGKWPIRQISIEEFDSIFKTNELGPTLATEVHFIGRGSLHVPGGTSDTEAWVLSALAKKSDQIFEFGTCTGKTTYLLAKNSPTQARITTITLAPDQLNSYERSAGDSKKSTDDAVAESAFINFLYSGTPEEKKITQLFGDSKHFDEKPFAHQMNLIFVDGSHAYSYVLSDSEKAFNMVAPNGIILWHDYRGTQDTADVFKAMNLLSKNKKLVHLKDTSLIAYRAEA